MLEVLLQEWNWQLLHNKVFVLDIQWYNVTHIWGYIYGRIYGKTALREEEK